MIDKIASVQARMLALLESQLAIAEKSQPKLLITETTNLARAIANLTAEMRKADAYEDDVIASFTPAKRDKLVRAYIEDLSKDRRRELLAQLQELDSKELLLG